MRTGIARRPLRLGLAFAFTIALVALGAVTLFNRPAPAGAAEILDKAHEAIASTQEGKVRHIVTSITNKRSGGGETSTTTEDWLATEGGRQLAKSVGPYNSSNLVADGTAVWIHFPQAKVVHKLTNGQKGLGGYISNRQMIEQMLKMPNTTIVGNSTLNGRAVIIIEGRDSVAGSKVELKPAPENGDTKDALLAGPVSFDLGDALPPDGSVYYRAWVDSQTYQIVQQEFGSISASGVAEVHSVRKVLVDELRNRSEFPDDLFTFKAPEGVKVVEMKDLPDLPEIRQSDKPGVSETPVP